MINDIDIPVGSYCWVLCNDSLEIMKKEFTGNYPSYSICGLWEGTYTPDDLSIISVIPKPLLPTQDKK